MVQPLIGKAGISVHCPLYKAGISYISLLPPIYGRHIIFQPLIIIKGRHIYLFYFHQYGIVLALFHRQNSLTIRVLTLLPYYRGTDYLNLHCALSCDICNYQFSVCIYLALYSPVILICFICSFIVVIHVDIQQKTFSSAVHDFQAFQGDRYTILY